LCIKEPATVEDQGARRRVRSRSLRLCKIKKPAAG
jgi:hypothetical protein